MPLDPGNIKDDIEKAPKKTTTNATKKTKKRKRKNLPEKENKGRQIKKK